MSETHFESNFVKFYPISFLIMWFSMENKLIEHRAILAQAKFNKLEGRSQLREAKLEELSLEIRDNLLIPSSLRLLS